MRNWIHALALLLALGAALPAVATPMTGADGPLVPVTDYTLPYRTDGLFDFVTIAIGSGVTLRFDAQMPNVVLRSLGDILIAGAVDAAGINLIFETPGQIVVTGSILAGSMLPRGSLDISTGARLCIVCDPRLFPAGGFSIQPGTLLLRPGGDLVLSASGGAGTLQLRPGGDIRILAPGFHTHAVPEPATPWLVTLLLPMLGWMGRTRI